MSGLVAGHLETIGYEVHRALARTAVVATLRKGTSARSVGVRADFDALPILEATIKPCARNIPGVMLSGAKMAIR